MSAVTPYVPFDVAFRAALRAPEVLAGRQLSGSAAQAAFIAEIPGLLNTLSASVAALASPTSTQTSLLVSDARAITHCIERLHDITYNLNGNT